MREAPVPQPGDLLALALLGIGLESRLIVDVAILVVLAGFALRFLKPS